MRAKLFLTIILITAVVMVISGCGSSSDSGSRYTQLSQDEAITMMEESSGYIILDVRTQEEYDKKHVRGAICVPIEDIRAGKLDKLPDKSRPLLLYCWTGRRSADAAAILAKQGYRNVCEFGGLVDWTGDVEGADVSTPAAAP